jgi:hypothetical protein
VRGLQAEGEAEAVHHLPPRTHHPQRHPQRHPIQWSGGPTRGQGGGGAAAGTALLQQTCVSYVLK